MKERMEASNEVKKAFIEAVTPSHRKLKCPECGSEQIHKCGFVKVKRDGKVIRRQRYRCYKCLRTMWGKE